MTVASHRMPLDVFAALAHGKGGPAAVGELIAAQHSKHLLLVHGVYREAGPDDVFAARGHDLLARVQRHDPAAVAEVITAPAAGAWAARTLRGDPMPGATAAGLSLLAAAAAIKAGLPAEIEVPVTDGVVMLPTLGAAIMGTASDDVAVVRTGPSEPEVCSAQRRVPLRPGAPGWRELRQVRVGPAAVLLDDLDPFRMPAADDLAPRLSPEDAEHFRVVLEEAWQVLGEQDAEEVAALVRAIVPYVTPPAGLVSSSSPEVFGTVAMSRQPDQYTCASTLVHEVQHVKLSALLDFVTLIGPDDGRRFYAPWRPDPRPASGLLQGAYAFLGVSRFWREQRQTAPEPRVRARAEAEYARWRVSAAEVAGTLLDSGTLTEAGRDFVAEMIAVLDIWLTEPVSAQALAQASREADAHLARWQADNG